MSKNGDRGGWVPSVRPTGARDLVLVCAVEPLRSALVEMLRARGYEPRVSVTPLQAVEELLARGDRIGHAIISNELPHGWASSLHEYIGDEYPGVQRVLLAC